MAKKMKQSPEKYSGPNLGLVCITFSERIRYRTITRTRYLALTDDERPNVLRSLYVANLNMLRSALQFCLDSEIKLYRMPSSIFPFADTKEGLAVLSEFSAALAEIGEFGSKNGIRIVAHPDQFVVLSSDSSDVIANSITVLKMHADLFDLMKLPKSAWAAIIIHGGKRGNGEVLKRTISRLPDSIRTRLTLENDEISYSSAEIFSICKATGCSMIFDAHHHLIFEKCKDYEDASIRTALELARTTWAPNEDWQLVHISNGTDGLHDRRHGDFIDVMPSCYADAEWIEVEARGKEEAIAKIKTFWNPASKIPK